MTRTRRVAVLLLLGCVLALFGAQPTSAQSEDANPDQLSIRRIDSTDPDAVKMAIIYNGPRADLAEMTVREDGREVETKPVVPLSKAGLGTSVVFVVDASRSMGSNGGITQTKLSIADAIQELAPGDTIGIVAFDSEARILVKPTGDREELLAGLNRLSAPADGRTALWDGIKTGAALLDPDSDLQPNMVLITDGFEDSSNASRAAAFTEVSRSGAAVFALGFNQQKQLDTKALNSLVGLAGGRLFSAPGTADLKQSLLTVRTSLRNQFLVEFASKATRGATDISVNVAGSTDKKTFVAGAIAQGNSALSPPTVDRSIVPDILTTGVGKLLALGAVGLAVALGVYALASLIGRTDSSLENVLMPYTDGQFAEEDENAGGLAQTAILQRAVEFTEDFAERQGFLSKVENKLEQADLPLRAAEAIFFWLAGAVVLSLLALVLGGLFGLIAGLLLFGYLPVVVVRMLAGRRRKAFNSQLPDMLQLLSGSLRAGYSFIQGLEAVSQEISNPMGKELSRVCNEARLGRQLESSLDGVAERMNSADFEWAVMAVRIQREVGGNLSELLDTVGTTMVERERLRREVAALTAEGKISAIILGILPPGIGAVMWLVNAEYLSVLFKETEGQVALVAAIVMVLVGFAWMKKTITIEI